MEPETKQAHSPFWSSPLTTITKVNFNATTDLVCLYCASSCGSGFQWQYCGLVIQTYVISLILPQLSCQLTGKRSIYCQLKGFLKLSLMDEFPPHFCLSPSLYSHTQLSFEALLILKTRSNYLWILVRLLILMLPSALVGLHCHVRIFFFNFLFLIFL